MSIFLNFICCKKMNYLGKNELTCLIKHILYIVLYFIFLKIFLIFLFNLKFLRKNHKNNQKINNKIHHKTVRNYQFHNKSINKNKNYILLKLIDLNSNYQKQINKN